MRQGLYGCGDLMPMETWDKINEYKEYGKWNTNQLMNHALSAFFNIVETDEETPELPLVCETLRELRRRQRSRFTSSKQKTSKADVVQSHDLPEEDRREESSTQVSEDKPWRDIPQEDEENPY